ncbi:MAG TPA: hypothetical protein PLE14_09715, partial [Anaerolineales bacterium]|nr:hypothetical protein [Anaerolineales bacterium]
SSTAHLGDSRSLLFTGYMVDYSGKEKKNFPPEKEAEIRQEIRKKLEHYKPDGNDRAFLPGLSAGSEIIFAELCIEMNFKIKVYLPMTDAAYIRDFVSPAGETWTERFYKVRNHSLVDVINQYEALGDPKEGDDLFERNNRWAVYSAIGRDSIRNVRLLAVANEGISSADKDIHLTRHMIDLMREEGGQVEFINPSKFIYNVIDNALERLMFDAASLKSSPAKSMKNALPEKKKPGTL